MSTTYTFGLYTYELFTASGTYTPPTGITSVDVLVVAGGGAGGSTSTFDGAGGGGGAGGVKWSTAVAVTAGVGCAVTVGAGGTAGAAPTNGTDSSFVGSAVTVTSTGGGKGGSASTGTGANGGSGGGGSGGANGSGGVVAGTGTAGQGNDGGTGAANSTAVNRAGGGGGGAGAVGQSAAGSPKGGGGVGVDHSANVGTSVGVSGWFGGGGGGGNRSGTVSNTTGGQGGGGDGATFAITLAAGAANTGGGGGGSRATGGIGGAGGSGVVIARYLTPSVDATLSATATITATGAVGMAPGASVAATDTITATGVLGTATGAAVSGTAAITPTGEVGKSSGASVAAVATITATAHVQADNNGAASLAATDTITATGAVGKATDAAISATATITADGVVGKVASATLSATATLTATGNVDTPLTASATVAATATITAEGLVTVIPMILTETWNRAGGRVRTGRAYLEANPAAVPDATPLPRGETRPRAHAYRDFAIDAHGVPTFEIDRCYGSELVYRLIVDGKNVTTFRGKRTPIPDYQFIEPFGYGPSVWNFETISALEPIGTGDLDWCDLDVFAKIQLVYRSTGVLHSTLWRGRFEDFTTGSDGKLQVIASGLWSGEAATRDMQLPLFGGRADVGRMIYHLAESVAGVVFSPHLGPETGIIINRFGGMRHLDAINLLCTRAQTRNKGPYTVMPEWGTDRFEMVEKDTTTIHGTIYSNPRLLQLQRQRSAEPDRIFGSGVAPSGQRVRNGRYPGLLDDPDEAVEAAPYPFDDNSRFGLGTTNADTDTGDGISVMLARLQTYGFLTRDDVEAGTYNAATVAAVGRLQDQAEIIMAPELLGDMTAETWDALFNIGRIGSSIWWAKVEPMAQAGFTRKWKLSADGSILAQRDGWDGERRIVDKTNNYGSGWTRAQMFDFAEKEFDDASSPNWFGDIDLEVGGIIRGDHTPGDAITDADFMDERELRAGMNFKIPHTNGGSIVVHCSTVRVSGGSRAKVSLSVDTRARDSAPLYEILQGNREARRNTDAIWWRQNRSSTNISDAVIEFDEVGGQINPVAIEADTYKVFRVLAGQIGMIEKLRIRTSDEASEFVVAIFGLPIDAAKLHSVCPDPLHDKQGWIDSMNDLNDNHRLLYIAGEPGDPAGYSPGRKSEGADLTGELTDEAGFPYRTGTPDKFAPWLHVAVYANQDGFVVGGDEGRILWNQELVGL